MSDKLEKLSEIIMTLYLIIARILIIILVIICIIGFMS
mgnify:CR=1 FL=1